MANSTDYINYVFGLLKDIQGITSRKMMGEYLLYKDKVLFGGIYDNRFLVKKTKSLCGFNLQEEIPYDGAKPMYLVNIEAFNEIEKMITLVVNDLITK